MLALINSPFLRTSMRLFSSSAKPKNFKLWYNKTLLDLKKLDTYRTFPVFLIYLSTLSKSALFDQTESLTKSGFAEDAARVSAGGFVYPSVSRKPPCKFLSARTIWLRWKSHQGTPFTDNNDALFMPNTYLCRNWFGIFVREGLSLDLSSIHQSFVLRKAWHSGTLFVPSCYYNAANKNTYPEDAHFNLWALRSIFSAARW